MRTWVVGITSAGLLAMAGCSGSGTSSSGTSTTSTTSSTGATSSTGGTSASSSSSGSTTGAATSSSSGGNSYGPGDDPDGGNAYPDGGFPPLACYPPPGYLGNLYGIGAYCSTSSPTCPEGDKCGTAVNPSFNFCVSLGVCILDGGGSLSQCGPGACCVPYMDGPLVCAPTGCVVDMLTDGGGCPDP